MMAPHKIELDKSLQSVDLIPTEHRRLTIDQTPSVATMHLEANNSRDESNYETNKGEGSVGRMNEFKPILLEDYRSPEVV